MVVRRVALVVSMIFVAGCSAGDAAPRAARTPEPSLEAPAPTPSPETEDWRKDRYIPVWEAVARLRRHVDFPVVLPRDRLAGLRRYRRWLADPKYTEWTRRGGVTVGTLKLVARRAYLLLDFGYSCGPGTATARSSGP
jgi:hypothetical protein